LTPFNLRCIWGQRFRGSSVLDGYPEIEEAHRASSLRSGEAAASWRKGVGAIAPRVPAELFPSPEDVIRAGRSTRRFRPGSIGRRQLESDPDGHAAARSWRLLLEGPGGAFLIVNEVDDLEPGVCSPG